MSFIENFRAAAWPKKMLISAFIAVNGVCAVNGGIMGFKLIGPQLAAPVTSGSTGMDVLFAPMMTGGNWVYSESSAASPIGPTPVSMIGNQTKKILPAEIDILLGLAFSVMGTPGAYAGHAAGSVSGAVTHYAFDPRPAPPGSGK